MPIMYSKGNELENPIDIIKFPSKQTDESILHDYANCHMEIEIDQTSIAKELSVKIILSK